jgi:ribosomal protein S20
LEDNGLACSGYSVDKAVYWVRTGWKKLEVPLFEHLSDVKVYKDAEKSRQRNGRKKRAIHTNRRKPNGNGNQGEKDESENDFADHHDLPM